MAEEVNPKGGSITIGSSLVPIVNRLRQIIAPFSGDGDRLSRISLPQVAVVGSQSSGKSSVLEALVGRDFLPRGCDVCTRRPLRLILEHRPRRAGDDGRDWGEFGHFPGRRYYNFQKIRQEIQAETEREAGCNKGVSDKEIVLKISSPNVLDMTLIDLPGITRVPVGDQPCDIETRIRRLIMVYISEVNCIILAVSPANSDLAVSDALKMAKEADPLGYRTVGVITKLDIMDRGTNACHVLRGKDFPLRLGYIGVVNRSQEDIHKKRTIQEALNYERRFFREHPEYNGLSDHCGIPQLAKKLNQILEQHIKTFLPHLTAELRSLEDEIVKELQIYGEVLTSGTQKGAILLDIVRRFCENFCALAVGKNQEMLTKQLFGGARIRHIFQSTFVKTLELLDPCENLTDEEIRTAIQNSTGLSSLFVPEVPVEILVRRQLARLFEPSLQCLKFVHDELVEMSHFSEPNELLRFPNLRKNIDELVRKFLHVAVLPAERMIESLIEIEIDCINLSHPDFLGGNNALELVTQQLQQSQGGTDKAVDRSSGSLNNQEGHGINERTAAVGRDLLATTWPRWSLFSSRVKTIGAGSCRSPDERPPKRRQISSTVILRKPPSILAPENTDRDEKKVLVTKLLLRSYFDIVKKNIQDLVPRTIMHFLVNHTMRNLHTALIQELYRETLFDVLLQEQDDISARRQHTKDMYRVLREVLETLDQVKSHAFPGPETLPNPQLSDNSFEALKTS